MNRDVPLQSGEQMSMLPRSLSSLSPAQVLVAGQGVQMDPNADFCCLADDLTHRYWTTSTFYQGAIYNFDGKTVLSVLPPHKPFPSLLLQAVAA